MATLGCERTGVSRGTVTPAAAHQHLNALCFTRPAWQGKAGGAGPDTGRVDMGHFQAVPVPFPRPLYTHPSSCPPEWPARRCSRRCSPCEAVPSTPLRQGRWLLFFLELVMAPCSLTGGTPVGRKTQSEKWSRLTTCTKASDPHGNVMEVPLSFHGKEAMLRGLK